MAFRPRRPVREAIMATETTRRAFLRSVAAASAGSLAAARFAQAAGPSIVAGSFAGVWVDGLKAGVIPCYKRRTGGDVELVVGTPTDFVQKVMATRDRPAIDAMIGTDADVFQNAQLGIIEKLQPAKVPNAAGILPIFREPYEGCAFGFDGGGDGVTYTANKVKNPPKSWIEFTERVAKGEFGRAVLYPHLTATDGLAITWLINRELGGSLNDPSPVIKRLREMKPYITKFWTSNAEPGTALTSGEVDIAAWTDGRTFGVQAAGNKHIQFALPAPGSPMLTICFMKVKNGSDGGVDQGDRRLAGMPALLLTPLLVFLLTFFVLPFGVMLVESLYLSPLQSPAGSAMTFANYAKAFGDAFYLRVLLQTVALGVAVTALALVLGYPVAYFLARTRSRRRHVLLFLVISPLVVSIVIRSYGWMVLLGRAGTVNTLLVALGLAERPLPLMYNWFRVRGAA